MHVVLVKCAVGVERKSSGSYDKAGEPAVGSQHLSGFFCARNPMGRTGLQGRGSLRYFGPNHAMHPVVTR